MYDGGKGMRIMLVLRDNLLATIGEGKKKLE